MMSSHAMYHPRRALGVSFVLLAVAGCSTPQPPQQNVPPAAPPTPVRYEGPPLPFEDDGACPFEGCTYRAWTTNMPVRVLTERRQDAPLAFELPKGARVTAVPGLVLTVVPGIFELTAASQCRPARA